MKKKKEKKVLLNKAEQKELKKFKRAKQEVIEAFGGRLPDNNHAPEPIAKTSNNMINSIAQSVVLNKRMLATEKENRKKWKSNYYQNLFAEFKKLVVKINEQLETDVDELNATINTKKGQIESLEEKIAELKERKKELINS